VQHEGEDEFRLRIAEQRAKTLLLEVPVIGERFGQPFVAHGLHRNAIDQAVTFNYSHGFLLGQP